MTDDLQLARKLGALIHECPWCHHRFSPRCTPRWWINTLYDGEFEDKDDDPIDLFCSEACAQQEADKRRTKRDDRQASPPQQISYFVTEDKEEWP